jgi:hypothetical protein
LDPIYPVLFVDTVVVKVRDGQVRNTPFYVEEVRLPPQHFVNARSERSCRR